jgi:hypothetical protein
MTGAGFYYLEKEDRIRRKAAACRSITVSQTNKCNEMNAYIVSHVQSLRAYIRRRFNLPMMTDLLGLRSTELITSLHAGMVNSMVR